MGDGLVSRLQYGSIPLDGTVMPVSLSAPPQFHSWRIDDLSAGLRPLSTLASREDGSKYQWYNEGIICLPGGSATLPPKSTAQTTLASVDISGTRAANGRVHGLMWPTSSGGRLIVGLGPNIYKDTSVSDPALTAPATADNVTDTITAMWTGVINGSFATIIGTNSTTDDIKYTTNPVADSISWSAGVTYANANDRCWWGAYLPDLGWHAFGGTINNVPGIYTFKGSTATPLTSSTLIPAVLTSGSDTPNPNATTQNTGAKSPTAAITTGAGTEWTNPTNALASDDSRATSSLGSGLSDFLAAFNFGFTVPTNATITGVLAEFERSEADAADNTTDEEVSLFLGITYSTTDPTLGQIGVNKADTSTEWPVTASEAYATYGGSADTWGAQLTPAIVNRSDFGFTIQADGSNAGAIAAVDHMRLTVYYKLPGTEVTSTTLGAGAGILATGGYTIADGPNPAKSNQVVIVQPKSNDATAVNVAREIIKMDFAHDADNGRLTFDPSRPYTGLATVDDACYHLGGVAAAGGPAFGTAVEVKLLTADDETYPLGFPQVHGTAPVRVAVMFPLGLALFAWVCHDDSTDCQLWMFFDGRWLPYGALWSKTLGGAMSTKPIPWAEKSMGTYQQQIYGFYPSSTNTAVIRQFVPSNPFADPNLTNTSQAKQDGPLYVQTPETMVWPPEDKNSVLALQSQSRRIDNAAAYGSLRVYMDTGGDTTVASAEIDQTFDATAETFTDRNLASSLDPGVAFKTLIVRLAADHQAGTTRTPNILPLVVHTVSQPPFLPEIEVRITSSAYEPKALMDKLESQQASKGVQRFSGGGYDDPFIVVSAKAPDWPTTLGGTQPTWRDFAEKRDPITYRVIQPQRYITLRLQQVRGGLS